MTAKDTSDIERLLRSGLGLEAEERLSALTISSLQRRDRARVAGYARRAGLVMLGLKILSPSVHSERSGVRVSATPAERAEYGALLAAAGSLEEADHVLAAVDPLEEPMALLYRAFAMFGRWDYQDALPLLDRFLAIDGLAAYWRLVGDVNRAQALVFVGRLDEAEKMIEAALSESLKNGYDRLVANAHELGAQVAFQRGDFAGVERGLRETGAHLGAGPMRDNLFIFKWQAAIAALRDGNVSLLEDFRRRAARAGQWESVREADFYMAKATGDAAIVHRLHFGTPFPAYRRRLLSHLPEGSLFPTTFVLGQGRKTLDLFDGTVDGKAVFKPGKTVHAALALLFTDFYRPWRVGALFSKLFPDEYFNVLVSPNRVHQAILGVRRALKKAALPIEILTSTTRSDFRFELGRGCGILIRSETATELSLERIQLTKLAQSVGSAEFTAAEARALLQLPLTSMNRLLKFALEKGEIRKFGSGIKTVYQFVAKPRG